MAEARSGAVVQYCGHDGTFPADIYKIGTANVVYVGRKVTAESIDRPAINPTHRITDFPVGGCWKPQIGVFVVPEDQVVEL